MKINDLIRCINICTDDLATCKGCSFGNQSALDCKTRLMLDCGRALQEYADILRYVYRRQDASVVEQKLKRDMTRKKSVYGDNEEGWIEIRTNSCCPHCGMEIDMLRNVRFHPGREEN